MRPRPTAPWLAILVALAGPSLARAEAASRLSASIAELEHADVVDTAEVLADEQVGPLTATAGHPAEADAALPSLDVCDLPSHHLPAASEVAGLRRPNDVHGPPAGSPLRHAWLRIFRC